MLSATVEPKPPLLLINIISAIANSNSCSGQIISYTFWLFWKFHLNYIEVDLYKYKTVDTNSKHFCR